MTDEILQAQLAALTAGSRKRWKQFRRFELICAACGETILEVMATQPHVILPRVNARKITYGLPVPLDGDDDEPIISICRCRSPVVTRADVRGWMSHGRTYVLPADQGSSARTHNAAKAAELVARFTPRKAETPE
jgi:hypothetical protein